MEPKRVIKQLKEALQKEMKISNVILFGSYSTKQNNSDSDFDVLVVLNENSTQSIKDKVRDICFDISLENDILIDSKIISEDDLKNKFWGKHPLYTDTLKNGIYA